MIEKIFHKEKMLSIIIRADFKSEGIEFFTSDENPFQLGYMNRGKEYNIQPHLHKAVKRVVHFTQEVLIIKSGLVRVDYYDDKTNYLESKTLYPGDVVLLAFGGHGFQMLKDSEILEIKQGPYNDDEDKLRFKSEAKIDISGAL